MSLTPLIKVNWQQVATDALTNAVGTSLGRNGLALIQAQREKMGNTTILSREDEIIKKFNLNPEKNFADNRFLNEMMLMENGGQVTDARRLEMTEFGMRQRGASGEEVALNMALLKDSKYDLFREAKLTPKSILFSATDSSYDIPGTIKLDQVEVIGTAGDIVPALFSSRVDSIAIGAGDLVQDVSNKIANNNALRYSLEVLDIVGAPVAYAARRAIEDTAIGNMVDEGKQYFFGKARGLFENVGYHAKAANSGGIGVFTILGTVVSGGAKALLSDIKRLGFQDHHIISDKNPLTKNHELLELSGYDLQKRQNKILLPINESLHPTRSIHWGKHDQEVMRSMAKQMDNIAERGKLEGWTQNQYRKELDDLVSQERKLLKSGDRALNKHQRDWAD